MRGSHRPDLYVVARILELLYAAPEGRKKTPLQQAAGLNYSVFAKYLELLEMRRLVIVEQVGGNAELVKLTQRGEALLRYLVDGIAAISGTDSGDRV